MDELGRFLQVVMRGLGQGSTYALVALGFVIIYKATKVLSLAQPALMVAGAVMVVYLVGPLDAQLLPPWGFVTALLLAMLLAAALGLVVERAALRPMVGKPVFVAAIITIGVDITIRVIVNRFIGLNLRSVRDPWGLSTITVPLGSDASFVVQHRHLAMVVITGVAVAILLTFYRFSRAGLAMRATAFDQEAALAQGINVGRMFALAWAIAGALAALAGTLVGAGETVSQGTWIIALKALPAIIIGGLDSLGGAVVGGLAVGVVESLVGSYQTAYFPWMGDNFSTVSPYLLLLLVMLVRPYGLFGTHEVERV